MTAATKGAPRPWAGNAGASGGPFAAALVLACIIHLLVILGVGPPPPRATPGDRSTAPALEIMVLRHATPPAKEPEVADSLAQVESAGGGLEEAERAGPEPGARPRPEIPEQARAAAARDASPPPLPEPARTPRQPPPAPAVAERPPLARRAPEPVEPRQVAPAVLALEVPVSEPAPAPLPMPEPEPPEPPEPPASDPPSRVTAARILASRNQEIAELTARIRRSSDAYANRPRRKAVSASTREYKYASYLEAWRRKVERVGNLNYPEEARRRKMYGNLILQVAVRADGSVEGIRVLRSSGFELLDEAAIAIVKLAAPFAPFPPEIRAQADVLDITRTWQFLSSNRLGWEK